MPYEPTIWQGAPSVATPITAPRLQKMEQGIATATQTADDSVALVDATYESLTSTKRRQTVPVAIKVNPPADASNNKSDGVLRGGTSKYNHLFTRSAYGIQLVYVNWVSGTSNTEMDGWNDITVAAAVEVSGSVMPVTFGGKLRTTISPGGTVVSDPIGIDVAKGATVSSRTYVEVPAGQFYPLSNIPLQSAGEGNNFSATPVDLTAAGSVAPTGGTSYGYGPAALLGQVIDPDKPVIAIVGDSIANGTGETSAASGGFFQRALGNNYSFQKVAYPGEALLSGWGQPNAINRRRRVSLLALTGVTHVVTDYTVNSLATTTLQTDAVNLWISLARVGTQGVYATTLTPQTTSTDAWATVANQTALRPAADEARRLAFNNWLRDGAPISAARAPVAPGTVTVGTLRAGQASHPLKGWFEVADLAESARDSGKWKAGLTGDGTHPNATGHAALALAIDATIFGPISAT